MTDEQSIQANESAGQDGLPAIEWMEVPAGPFIYQDDEQREEALFYIARVPITYADFQLFIDDPDGFHNPRWWEGLAASEEDRSEPGEQRYQVADRPRERVSWYEAIAFCRWLTAQAEAHPTLLPEAVRGEPGWQITLPTEWQWEKAARGSDGRKYPYGNDFDAEKGNTLEANIEQTSAVGSFPQGASPYGVLDMSGNVWEWCLNEYDKPERIALGGDAGRVGRGGAFNLNQARTHCTARAFGPPGSRHRYLGFRVCVSRSSEE
jgi:formylglycine-generating enzyme required for sulfatase activity